MAKKTVFIEGPIKPSGLLTPRKDTSKKNTPKKSNGGKKK